MVDIRTIIREKMHWHNGDSLPFVGWVDFSRTTLAECMGKAGFKVGCEVGVRKGDYSLILCQKIPALKIFCVDPWGPYRGRRPSQARMDAYYEITKQKLSPFDATLIRKTSMEAANEISDGSLDFVYIDAMHEFDPVMMDIIKWEPKVKPGGIVAGHDYWESGYQVGVVPAVRAYTGAHNISEWYITNNIIQDKTFSWFWIKK